MNACILRAPRSIIAPRLWSLGAVKTANFDPYAPPRITPSHNVITLLLRTPINTD